MKASEHMHDFRLWYNDEGQLKILLMVLPYRIYVKGNKEKD
jgi:hypothetical protein